MASWPGKTLTRGDALHSKRITARPSYFVLGLAIRADGDACHFFSQPGRTDKAHAPAAMRAPENFLQHPLPSTLFYSHSKRIG
jgi:hypothetical protein